MNKSLMYVDLVLVLKELELDTLSIGGIIECVVAAKEGDFINPWLLLEKERSQIGKLNVKVATLKKDLQQLQDKYNTKDQDLRQQKEMLSKTELLVRRKPMLEPEPDLNELISNLNHQAIKRQSFANKYKKETA